MKTIVATMAVLFLLVVNWPAKAFQTHPRPTKVKKHRGKKHRRI